MRRLLLLMLVGFGAAAAAAAQAGINIEEPANSVGPYWLADGQHIGFTWSSGVEPYVQRQPYVVGDDGSGMRPATTDDVAAPAQPLGLARIGADGNAWYGKRRLTTGGAVYAVAWIDARTLAVGFNANATDIDAIDVRTGRSRRLVSGYSAASPFAISPDGSEIAFTSWVGWAYDRGEVVYVASTHGTDTDVRRVTPDTCTVKQTLYAAKGACVDGTDGVDRLAGTHWLDVVVAGPGDDTIHAGEGENVVFGQWGDDTLLSGSGIDIVNGGGGNDAIRSGAGNDHVDPGPGRDTVDAGSGNDTILANDGERDTIDCGPGVDSVRADRVDVLRNCERVRYAEPELNQALPT